MLQQLRHPYIIGYISYFVSGTHLNIVLEYAAGGDLSHRIKAVRDAGNTFAEEDILVWFSQVCTCTIGYLSFGTMAQCVVHALKGLVCRARVTPASSPASHSKQCSVLTLLRSTRAAAPVLLAHAEVTKNIVFFQWVNLGNPRYSCAGAARMPFGAAALFEGYGTLL